MEAGSQTLIHGATETLGGGEGIVAGKSEPWAGSSEKSGACPPVSVHVRVRVCVCGVFTGERRAWVRAWVWVLLPRVSPYGAPVTESGCVGDFGRRERAGVRGSPAALPVPSNEAAARGGVDPCAPDPGAARCGGERVKLRSAEPREGRGTPSRAGSLAIPSRPALRSSRCRLRPDP